MIFSALVAYLPHLIFGDSLSFTADFLSGTILGGIAYVAGVYYLKKWRGDF